MTLKKGSKMKMKYIFFFLLIDPHLETGDIYILINRITVSIMGYYME